MCTRCGLSVVVMVVVLFRQDYGWTGVCSADETNDYPELVTAIVVSLPDLPRSLQLGFRRKCN
jgi:hypothetical protein